MKLYDGGRAPNPRRVRVFLAEKGITIPDRAGRSRGACSRRARPSPPINPMQRVPALVLDDGTVITESIAICRYFEALHPDPPLFGRGALNAALVEMWNRRVEFHLFIPVSHIFRHLHPAMKEMESPQVKEWGEANKPRALSFLEHLDDELAKRNFIAGDDYTRRRHHRDDRDRFHARVEHGGAGRADSSQTLVRCRFGASERQGVASRRVRLFL